MKFKSALIQNIDHQNLYALSQVQGNDALAFAASAELQRRIQVSEDIEASKRRPRKRTAAQVVQAEQEAQ